VAVASEDKGGIHSFAPREELRVPLEPRKQNVYQEAPEVAWWRVELHALGAGQAKARKSSLRR
jgi:hypothetical protein